MLLIEPKNDFSIRMRYKSVALGLELGSQYPMIINLTVVHEHHPAIGAAHWLSAGVRQIQNSEPEGPQRDCTRRIRGSEDGGTASIRPAVSLDLDHRVDRAP